MITCILHKEQQSAFLIIAFVASLQTQRALSHLALGQQPQEKLVDGRGLLTVLLVYFVVRPLVFSLIGDPKQTRTVEEASDPRNAKGVARVYVAIIGQLLKAPIMVAVLGLLVLVFSLPFLQSLYQKINLLV